MERQQVVGASTPTPTPTDLAARRLDRWQRRLLPFINRALVALMVFFFLISLVQMGYLHWRIARSPKVDLQLPMSMLAATPAVTAEARAGAARTASLILLEANSIDRRYHQGAVVLMARVWTSYLGFVTGMVLVSVGAIFVWARVQTTRTRLEAEFTDVRLALQTAAPGLILAALGVTLMLASLFVKYDLTITDRPLYVVPTGDSRENPPSPSPPPVRFPTPPVSPSPTSTMPPGPGKSDLSKGATQ